MKRESGYYWVLLQSDRWTVGWWQTGISRWYIPCDEETWFDYDFKKIDERKIERP